MVIRFDRLAQALLIAAAAAMLTACSARSPQAATPTPLTAIDREISLELFMGDWFVLASIPIDIPFFSEADAYNGVESYVLTEDGTIDTTYAFRDGGFDGAERRFTPSAQVYNTTTNAEWRMQFLWPFRSAYLIVYLDEEYSKTIIGVPDRSHAWIMSRTPSLPQDEYRELVNVLENSGHEIAALRVVPQCWPEHGCTQTP